MSFEFDEARDTDEDDNSSSENKLALELERRYFATNRVDIKAKIVRELARYGKQIGPRY